MFQRTVLGTQLLSTLALFGLIWFVQLVHYPLFLRIAPADFPAFEAEHATRTGWIAGPLMVAEFLSALLLLLRSVRPAQIPAAQAWLGAALVGILWLSTFFVQVPLHNQLHQGFQPAVIQRLVATNWLRTAAWTVRAALIVFWAGKLCNFTAP